MLTAWARWTLGAGRIPVLVGVALLTGVFASTLWSTRLDHESESMNARPLDQERVRERFAASFGGAETIVVGVRDEDLLESAGIEGLRELVSRIEGLDGVARVLSLLDAVEVVSGPFGAEERPLFPEGQPAGRTRIEAALARDSEGLGMLVAEDARATALLVELESASTDADDRATLVDRLRALKREMTGGRRELHVTGIAVQKHDTARLVARDQRVILPASVLVFALALVVITRRRSGVVLPLVVTAITLVWTLGALTLFGYELNVITSLLPPVVMVLSIATSVHLYQEWIALSRNISDPRGLALAVVERLGMPCVLTAFTTALGLASLGVSDIPAVRQFGLVAALGVVFSLFLNLTLLPMAFAHLRPEKRRRESPSRLTPALDRAVAFTVRAPATIVVLALLFTLAALAGITRIENDTDLISFLPQNAELVRDTRWVDRELVGTNTLELLVERVDGEPLVSPSDLRALDTLAHRIGRLDEVTDTLSITAILARVHQAEEGLDEPTIPPDAAGARHAFDLMASSPRADDLAGLITPDLRAARIAVRLRAIGTAEGERVVDAIMKLASEELGEEMQASPTGDFLAIVRDSNRLVERQISSFGLALATILVTLALFLRSIRLMLAACIPNIVPIIWCLGAMGWFGITLSTATTMVASVVIGVAVDGTIHYLSRFRREHRGDVAAAVRATTHGTGRVLVIASVVLALGFWVGALGSFRPTIWFSLLTGGTIVAALVCDLVVLPACLVLLRPRCSTMRS